MNDVLFAKPLPISPTQNNGLPIEDETLWFDRLLKARQMIVAGRNKGEWTKKLEHCRNFICAANYAMVIGVSKKLAAGDETLAEELESGLGQLLAHAVDHFNRTRAKITNKSRKTTKGVRTKKFSTFAYHVLWNAGVRLMRKERNAASRFRTNVFNREEGKSDGIPAGISMKLSNTSEKEKHEINDMIELLDVAMHTAKLTNPERLVLDLRFRQDLTLEDAGKQMGLTRERIRQIQAKALKKLREVMDTHE